MNRQPRWIGRARLVGLVVGIVLAAGPPLALTPPAGAAGRTFTVNSTADDVDSGGCQERTATTDCTLREAINAANADLPADTVAFAIPGGGVKSIRTGGFAITRPLTIDGYTQTGARPNTGEQGTDAVLKIELDGTVGSGLVISGGNTTVRGLIINNFQEDNSSNAPFGGFGIELRNAAGNTNNVIEGNFIGTNPDGTAPEANAKGGVFVDSTSTGNRIGGSSPAARNLISGNGGHGVFVGSANNTIQGNLIGTDKTGTRNLGNGLHGVFFGAEGADGNAVTANTVAFSGAQNGEFFGGGVVVQGGAAGNRIARNAIFANARLGIDLTGGIQNIENANDVTANDPGDATHPPDADTGPNQLQNYPVLRSATTAGRDTTIKGKLISTPNTDFVVQFFANPANDRTEGRAYLGQKRVVTDGDGIAPFTFKPKDPVPAGLFVTATATDNDTDDTSEFAAPREVKKAG